MGILFETWTDSRPTCLYLASKSHNNPIPLDIFVSKFAKLTKNDVLDTEFLVAQSLSFEFWTRGADKPLRGWALEFQVRHKPGFLLPFLNCESLEADGRTPLIPLLIQSNLPFPPPSST